MNGHRSVVKANQAKYYPYNEAWLNVEPDGIIEKTFYLQAYPVKAGGSGFESALTASIDIFKPGVSENMPSIKDIIQDKYRLATSRFVQTDQAAGFSTFPTDQSRKEFGIGWVGQASYNFV